MGSVIKEVIRSYQQGQTRDVVEDSKRYIQERGIGWDVQKLPTNFSDHPTIIVANHFLRPFAEFGEKVVIKRVAGNSPTTPQSFETTSVITLAINEISTIDLKWLVKGDLKNGFFSNTRHRQAQQALIASHNHIPVFEKGKRQMMQDIGNTLISGKHVAFYPEGVPSYTLQQSMPGYATIFKLLQKSGVPFQVLPVSIYSDGKTYMVKFGETINGAQNAKDIAATSMTQIAANLPAKFRPDWKV